MAVWNGCIIAIICLFQFFVSVSISLPYDPSLISTYFWIIWYPVIYWAFNAFAAIVGFPKGITKRFGKAASWKSPDRGVGSGRRVWRVFSNGFDKGYLINGSMLYVDKGLGQELFYFIDKKYKSADIKSENVSQPEIIKKPEFLSVASKVASISAKAVFNALLYAFVLITTISLWGFSGAYLYSYLMVPLDTRYKTIQFLQYLVIFAVAAFIVMFSWQKYNYHMFGKKKQRAFPPPVPDEQIAGANKTDVNSVLKLRQAKTARLARRGKENTDGEKRVFYLDTGEEVTLGCFDPSFKLSKP
jgi:poly-beta-1,6-N-acetyl-D-glucosamine biosynthesis protein PgaD